MFRNAFSLCVATLLAGSVFSCKNERSEPQPSCYGGTVVATSCMLGVLIDVDAAHAIGAPATSAQSHRFLGSNVVAVANSASLPGLGQVGRRVYFTYQSTTAPAPTRYCLDNDGTTTAVPFVTLSNTSLISCDSVSTK